MSPFPLLSTPMKTLTLSKLTYDSFLSKIYLKMIVSFQPSAELQEDKLSDIKA